MDITALLSSVLPSASPPTTPQFGFGGGTSGLIVFLGFIAVAITIRMIRGFRGRRFSKAIVLRLPVMYLLITVIAVIPLEISYPIALTSLAAIPAGFLIGYLFGREVHFFEQNGTLFFKRSPIIMGVWLASFLVRIVLEFKFSGNLQILFAVDALLALTSGLLVGEALHVLRSHREYTNQAESPATDDSDYVKEF